MRKGRREGKGEKRGEKHTLDHGTTPTTPEKSEPLGAQTTKVQAGK